MSASISTRDFELLSAYLDGQLQGTARQRLEARLGQEAVLMEGFRDLQRMRSVLRSLPMARAPRNFTLTPKMVGQVRAQPDQPRFKLYPVLGFASALASLLFVLVVLSDILGFLPGSQQGANPQVAMEASAPSTEVALQSVPSAADTGPVGITEEAAMKFAPETATSEAPMMEMQAAPAGTDAAYSSPDGTPELAQGAAGPPTEDAAAAAGLAQPAAFPTDTPQPFGGGLESTEPAASAKLFGNGTPTPTLTYTPTPPPTETPVPTPTGVLPTMVEPTEAFLMPIPIVEPSPTQEVLALAVPPTEQAAPAAETFQSEPMQETPDAQREFLPEPSPTPNTLLTPRILLMGIQLLLLGLAVVTGIIALILRFRER